MYVSMEKRWWFVVSGEDKRSRERVSASQLIQETPPDPFDRREWILISVLTSQRLIAVFGLQKFPSFVCGRTVQYLNFFCRFCVFVKNKLASARLFLWLNWALSSPSFRYRNCPSQLMIVDRSVWFVVACILFSFRMLKFPFILVVNSILLPRSRIYNIPRSRPIRCSLPFQLPNHKDKRQYI